MIMKNKMSPVKICDAQDCAYNKNLQCHAMAINVGGPEVCPNCDTFMSRGNKGGIPKPMAGVGACKVEQCKFNELFECNAKGIEVRMHSGHADCGTYSPR